MPLDASKNVPSNATPESLDPRCPVVLLLDTSINMNGAPITALNAGLRAFQASIARDARAAQRVEIAIVTIGEAQKFEDFIPAGRFSLPFLQASGVQSIGPAINLTLDIIEERLRDYKAAGLDHYKPWVFFVSARAPDAADDAWDEAALRVNNLESKRAIAFFSVGLEGVALGEFKRLSPTRLPLKLLGLRLTDMFEWLATSLTKVAHSKLGEDVKLEPFTWGSV